MGEQGKADKYKSVQHLGGESSLVTVFFYLFIDIMRCVCVFCPVGVMNDDHDHVVETCCARNKILSQCFGCCLSTRRSGKRKYQDDYRHHAYFDVNDNHLNTVSTQIEAGQAGEWREILRRFCHRFQPI